MSITAYSPLTVTIKERGLARYRYTLPAPPVETVRQQEQAQQMVCEAPVKTKTPAEIWRGLSCKEKVAALVSDDSAWSPDPDYSDCVRCVTPTSPVGGYRVGVAGCTCYAGSQGRVCCHQEAHLQRVKASRERARAAQASTPCLTPAQRTDWVRENIGRDF